ncbi:MAG: hypothetical protein ACYCTE_09380 [Acidimicrobiales bacterium]
MAVDRSELAAVQDAPGVVRTALSPTTKRATTMRWISSPQVQALLVDPAGRPATITWRAGHRRIRFTLELMYRHEERSLAWSVGARSSLVAESGGRVEEMHRGPAPALLHRGERAMLGARVNWVLVQTAGDLAPMGQSGLAGMRRATGCRSVGRASMLRVPVVPHRPVLGSGLTAAVGITVGHGDPESASLSEIHPAHGDLVSSEDATGGPAQHLRGKGAGSESATKRVPGHCGRRCRTGMRPRLSLPRGAPGMRNHYRSTLADGQTRFTVGPGARADHMTMRLRSDPIH